MSRQDNSASNQRLIILQALRQKPQSTNDLRCNYGIMQPAARVLELKAKGYKIDTVIIDEATPYDGIKHKGVARYVLQPNLGGEL
jgi:hypothetical protein